MNTPLLNRYRLSRRAFHLGATAAVVGAATTACGDDDEETPEGNGQPRSEEHTSELQSRENVVCRLLLGKENCHRRGGSGGQGFPSGESRHPVPFSSIRRRSRHCRPSTPPCQTPCAASGESHSPHPSASGQRWP